MYDIVIVAPTVIFKWETSCENLLVYLDLFITVYITYLQTIYFSMYNPQILYIVKTFDVKLLESVQLNIQSYFPHEDFS